MGTMTIFEVTVFDPQTSSAVPARFLTQHGLEAYLKQVIRHLDGSLDTDQMDFEACKSALKYLKVTVALSKIKINLEDLL